VGGDCEGWEFDGDSGVPPTPTTQHLQLAAPLLFPGNRTNVYQALHLNFYVGPRLTIGTSVDAIRDRQFIKSSFVAD
jgi:hypothetical protein